MIDYLKYWAQYVDGYRCDVAPLLPIDFGLKPEKKWLKLSQTFFG